jgi:hypothetical protein
MKKFIKNNILGFIIGIVLMGTITAVYAINASNITYNDTTVSEALDDLYQKKQIKYISGTNNGATGTESITIDRDCDKALIVSGQQALEYSINSTDSFQGVTQLGSNYNGIGFYYSYIENLKKDDIIYLKRNTSDLYAYFIIY